MNKLEFDVVMATRNRTEALTLSIPSILNQERRPNSIVVVDSSDDHDSVIKTIREVSERFNYPINLIKSEIASSSGQRNIGLNYVEAPIVIFPDDDSIFFPGAIEAIMNVYEHDEDKKIAGVCAAESMQPPEGLINGANYRLKKSDSAMKKVANFRFKLERKYFPEPFISLGQEKIDALKKPNWLNDNDHVLVEFMTGFRMSFRTEVIKKSPFCEVFSQYCLFEDTEACFSAFEHGLLVGAKNAKIYHHKFPSKRAEGFRYGAIQVLNRAYVVSKHAKDSSKIISILNRYSVYKLLQYLLAFKSEFGRSRFKGAWYGFKNMKHIIDAKSANERDAAYKQLVNTNF